MSYTKIKLLMTYIFIMFFNLLFCQTIEETSKKLATAQLTAYNNRDIEAFILPYSDSVKVYGFPNILQFQGKDIMRKEYSKMFADFPDLHCELVNRMVLGNTVIDQESVTFRKDHPKLQAIAIYKVWNEKIQEVYFISNGKI